jgi:hypothetical protein
MNGIIRGHRDLIREFINRLINVTHLFLLIFEPYWRQKTSWQCVNFIFLQTKPGGTRVNGQHRLSVSINPARINSLIYCYPA